MHYKQVVRTGRKLGRREEMPARLKKTGGPPSIEYDADDVQQLNWDGTTEAFLQVLVSADTCKIEFKFRTSFGGHICCSLLP